MEYLKIETLYERDLRSFKVNPAVLKNRVYGLIKTWQFTEKIDGMNIRCIWEGGKLSFGGRTDKAQIPGDLIKWLYENVSASKLQEIFQQTGVVIYGEGYGAGIQKGGGDYSTEKRFIVFDILVEGKWWLNRENVLDIAVKLGLETVPFIGNFTLEEATELVRQGFPSRLNEGKRQAEGMVGRTIETLFDKNGSRLIVKLKTKDF